MGLPRTLTLHESALTNGEYTSYTTLWDELVEPGEDILGVREVRGWMKGRFTSIDPSLVDQILRLFHPNLGAADTLNQGQFFAVLRLLTHVMGNASKSVGVVDGGLVFVQPMDPFPLSVSTPRGEAPNPVTAPPPAGTYNSSNPNNPFASRYAHPTNNDIPSASPARPSTSMKPTSSRPVSNPPPSRNNTIVPPPTRNGNIPLSGSPGRAFSNSVSNSALSSDEGSVPEVMHPTIRASSSPNPPIPNPFLARANSIGQSIAPPLSPPTSAPLASTAPLSGMQDGVKAVPPALPPRKPSFLPPPRHASQQPSVASASSTKSTPMPPVKPPKPSHFQSPTAASVSAPFNALKTSPNPSSKKEPNPPTTSSLPGHNISPLIKQGLLAAKGAQLSAERGLDKLRTWEIIKTSSGTPSPAMKERNASADRERAGSVSSEGRSGRIQSTTRHVRNVSSTPSTREWEHSRSPPLPPGAYPKSVDEEEEEGPFAGPTSPLDLTSSTSASGTSYGHAQVKEEDDVFASPISPNFTGPRMTRSKSLHSGGTPPAPPPRRRRPESVQIGPSTPTAEERSTWIPGSYLVEDGPFGDDSQPASASSRKSPPKTRASIGYGLGAAELTTPTQSNPVGTKDWNNLSGSNTVAHLRNQFHSLSMKTKPGLETARAKVEGKLIPGGYGKWGSEGLTTGDGLGPFKRGRLRKTTGGVDGAPAGRRGSEGSEEDAGEVDDDTEAEEVRRNGWRPLKG